MHEEVNKSLSQYDKQRFSELIDVYLNPKVKYHVKNDGTVVVNKHGPFVDWFLRSSESEDFLSSCHILIELIREKKKDIPYVESLLGQAIGILVSTNERDKVVTNLYMAHLVEAQPNFRTPPDRSRELTQKIEDLERRPKTRVSNIFIGGTKKMNTNRLADLLNSSPHVLLVEEDEY